MIICAKKSTSCVGSAHCNRSRYKQGPIWLIYLCTSNSQLILLRWQFRGLFRYTVKAFNFYVFPRPFSRQAPDIRFMCQVNSLFVSVNMEDHYLNCNTKNVVAFWRTNCSIMDISLPCFLAEFQYRFSSITKFWF